MQKPGPYVFTGRIEARQRAILPGRWLDYMGKDFSTLSLRAKTALLGCIDRARIVLQDHDSHRVLETIEIVEVVLALFFGDDVSMPVESTDPSPIFQRLFQRGDISESLALALALQSIRPRFYAGNRHLATLTAQNNGATAKQLDWYGVNPEDELANPKFLAALALRDAFAAAKLLIEADAYRSAAMEVSSDEDTELDDLLRQCEEEAALIAEGVFDTCLVAAEKLAQAVEAVCLAETLILEQEYTPYLHKPQEKHVQERIERTISELAVRAATQRHAVNRELRAFALALYKAGEFKSVLQAAKKLFPKVQDRAKELGRPMSAERGEKTLYEWLLQDE